MLALGWSTSKSEKKKLAAKQQEKINGARSYFLRLAVTKSSLIVVLFRLKDTHTATRPPIGVVCGCVVGIIRDYDMVNFEKIPTTSSSLN